MTELTLDQALQQGIKAHKAGRFQEADRYYTAILKANPKHPDANHNMGVLAVGVDKVDKALPFFEAALEKYSNVAQYWISYIDALIKLDQIDEAKAMFKKAMKIVPMMTPLIDLDRRLVCLIMRKPRMRLQPRTTRSSPKKFS